MKKHIYMIYGTTLLIAAFLLISPKNLFAQETNPKVRIYIDADRTGTRASGISIEQGIRTALSEIENKLDGRDVEIVIKDHRGSSPRSKRHLEAFLEDPKALVVFSGLHSPPLLTHKNFINENQILVLDPWAAAGPITRSSTEENWIFRLSIDDSKAGFVVVQYASEEGFTKPYLLLEDTGWGKSNEKTMTEAFNELGISVAGIEWFNWNLGENQAKTILRKIADKQADVILLVANAPEGKTFAKAMGEMQEEKRLPIRSHWGITGGNFSEVIDLDTREKIDLKFIQTSYSFLGQPEDSFGGRVFKKAAQLFPDVIHNPKDIKAPTGFIHAYDLTRILIAAVRQAGLTGDVKNDRINIKNALENLDEDVVSLIKTYSKPFAKYTPENQDAHEALAIEDFTMAKYGKENEIKLLNWEYKPNNHNLPEVENLEQKEDSTTKSK